MRRSSRKWQARYRPKLVDAAAAVRCVRRGQRVFIGSGAAEPQALVAALAKRAGELTDAEIIHILTLGMRIRRDPAPKKLRRSPTSRSS